MSDFPLTHEELMELARISAHLTGEQTHSFARATSKLLDYVIRTGGMNALENLKALPIEIDPNGTEIYGGRVCFRFTDNPER